MTKKARREREPAEGLPVARVCVDVPLPHLDRLFDYLVPVEFDTDAQAGTRVRVRFAGQLVDGWLIERVAESAHGGRLAWLEKVVSPEPVLRPEIAALARQIADRYAGGLADVLRLAVPPRQATVEKQLRLVPPPPSTVERPARAGWGRYPAGEAFLAGLEQGRGPRAVWSAMPGEDWPARLAETIGATLHSGRGAVAVVADARDLRRLDDALTALIGRDMHVALAAALGPAERYRRFLRASRGEVRAVIGMRAAAFAPVGELGLVAIWDDGDDLHAEPRAPYPHARQVLLTRAQVTGAGALVGGFVRTAEAQQLLATGWAKEIVAPRETLRRVAPNVQPADDKQLARDPAAASARLPSLAWQAARESLAAGHPVLIQVPRRGYVPAVSCQDCRERARCPHCAGPLALGGAGAPPSCRWCARPAADYTCPVCGGRRLRAAVTGVRRTAEEIGRALPGYPVWTSGGDNVLATVAAVPALVLATPGAEPLVSSAPGGEPAAGGEPRGVPGPEDVPPASGESGVSVRGDGPLEAARSGPRALRSGAGGDVRGLAGGAGESGAGGGALGYGAVLLLDAWALLTRADLRAGEETARRWFSAAALARPGGRVVVVADGALAQVQALIRWDPGWLADRELAERRQLGFPPAARIASLTGTAAAVADLLEHTSLPEGAELLGPLPVGEEQERMLVRVRPSRGLELAEALHIAAGVRSARKGADPVRVQFDPMQL